MMQTLLTGFGPFGNVVDNPTARLLQMFEFEELPGQELTTLLLPTSFQQAPERLRAALEIGGRGGQPFDALLMLGVAAGSPWFRVERQGHNRTIGNVPDCDGALWLAGTIETGGPESIPVAFPVEKAANALEQVDLPVRISDTAGEYVCNHLLYSALRFRAERNSPALVGFLHVPADEVTLPRGITTAPVIPFYRQVLAVRTVLEQLPASGELREF